MIYYFIVVGGLKMNQKGFSLLELLAIIVILAIIAVVATPIVLSIIENSRKSAFSSSVIGIKDAIENDYSSREFAVGSSYTFEDGKLYYTDGTEKVNVPLSGHVDGTGVGYVDSNGNIYVAIYTGSYCGTLGITGKAGTDVTESTTEDACLDPVRQKMTS